MMWRRARAAGCALAFAVVLGGCGDGNPEVEVTDRSDPEPGGDAERTDAVYDCFGVTTTIAGLEEAPLVSDLADHPGAAAFAANTDSLERWRAVRVEDERLEAVRELDPPETLDGALRDHERLAVALVGAAALPDSDEDRWEMVSAGACVLQADLGELGPASVTLDGPARLDDADSQLELLVVEQACASGEDAAGRVRVDVTTTDDEIRLVVGVEPRGGDQNCPSNPPTPVTVDLDEPIAGRRVVDAGRYPPIEITPGP